MSKTKMRPAKSQVWSQVGSQVGRQVKDKVRNIDF